MMDNSGDADGYHRPARRRHGDRGDDVASLPDAYVVVGRVRAWKAAHPGWSLDRHADLGYWEAFRVRGAERITVCRHSLDDLDVRVDEILAAEARAEAEAEAAAVRGPDP
jgi:hypothetical protein